MQGQQGHGSGNVAASSLGQAGTAPGEQADQETGQESSNKMADIAAQLQSQYGTHIDALNRQLKEQRETTLRMEQLCQEQAQLAEAALQHQQAQHTSDITYVQQQAADHHSAVQQQAHDMASSVQSQCMAQTQGEVQGKQRLREVEPLRHGLAQAEAAFAGGA